MFISAMAPVAKGYSTLRYTRPMGATMPSLKVCNASMDNSLSVTFAARRDIASGAKSTTFRIAAKVTHMYTVLRNSSKPFSSTSVSH